MSQLSNIVVAAFALGACASAALGFAASRRTSPTASCSRRGASALLALFMLALRLPLAVAARDYPPGEGPLRDRRCHRVVVAPMLRSIATTSSRRDPRGPRRSAPASSPASSILCTGRWLTYDSGDLDGDLAARPDRDRRTAIHCSSSAPSTFDRPVSPETSAFVRTTPPSCRPATAGSCSTRRQTLSLAAARAYKEKVDTICFVTGHGRTFRPTPSHFHFGHAETLRGHDVPGAGDILDVAPADLDRLQLALTEIGYVTRPIVPASANVIPADCAVVAEVGPRTAFHGRRSRTAGQIFGRRRKAVAADRSGFSS